MSLHEIQKAVNNKLREDEIPTDLGRCRDAAILLLRLAWAVDISEPRAEHSLLVWPDLPSDPTEQCVHYAFKATSTEGTLYINVIKEAGFPLFNQISDTPPGRLRNMKEVPEVI